MEVLVNLKLLLCMLECQLAISFQSTGKSRIRIDDAISAQYLGGIEPLSTTGIQKGGNCNSFDIYSSQPETQAMVAGQIASWVKDYLSYSGPYSHSVVFASLDGERVIHNIGWKSNNAAALKNDFTNFRDAADSSNKGPPVALKER